jgi:hypothetical protein
MPRRMVNLYTCWWTAGSTHSAVVWKKVPSCLLWCLMLRERNNTSFEDHERTLDEIKALFFSIYL